MPDLNDLPGLVPQLVERLGEIPDPTGDIFSDF